MRFFFFVIVCISLASCSQREAEREGTVFRYNESANITSLDPAFARDQAIIWGTNQIFNGLVQPDTLARIRPCIAHRWEISASGLIYTFYLRNDVFFHDDPSFPRSKGRKVVAADFVYSLGRLTDPLVASPGAWVMNAIDPDTTTTAIQAVDDTTLRIRLREPFPPLLSLLSMQYCSVVPHEAVEYYGASFRNHPVGTGPFRFKFWQEGVKLVLEKNPHYFETLDGTGLPYLDAVAISFIPDKQTVFLNFLQGKFDFMSGIDAAYKDELLTAGGALQSKYKNRITLITQPYLNTEYLGFVVDSSKNEQRALLYRNIRQAINLAFDRKKMIRYLRNNRGTPGIQGIIPKGLPAYDSLRIYYDHDPHKASALLAEAGYPGGRGLPPVTLVSTPDYLDICRYIQHQVAELGINLNIEVSTPAAMKEMKAEAKLGFFRASWIADYPDAENYLSMFLSRNFCPQGPNYTHYSNDRFDRLYQQAMLTVDDDTRISLYREMEGIMMADAPVVVLYYDQVLRFTGKNITGLGSNPMNLLTLKYVRKLP